MNTLLKRSHIHYDPYWLIISLCWLIQSGSKKAKRDDEFDMADLSDIQPRARSGRAASKPVKYNFDSDDDDDENDDDDM